MNIVLNGLNGNAYDLPDENKWPQPLFHGNFREYWELFENFCPDNWTDSPLDALCTIWNNVDREKSKLLIICIPQAQEKDFEIASIGALSWIESKANQYCVAKNGERLKPLWKNRDERKKFINDGIIETYNQEQLPEFIKNYFNSEQKVNLKKYGNIDLQRILERI